MGVVYFLLSIRSECIHMSYTLTLAGLLGPLKQHTKVISYQYFSFKPDHSGATWIVANILH